MRILLLTILLVGAPLMAVETEPEPPGNAENPEKATGPLSAQEEKFQGTWKGGYTLTFEGRDFCADTQPGEWYEGYIVIRTDEEPAQIDFVILVQSGERGLKTSKGIFYWDGETLVVRAPPPEEARPQEFKADDKTVPTVRMRLKRDGQSQHPATHCLGETP
jgi:uncharacterized protein (TIGR03067 family)